MPALLQAFLRLVAPKRLGVLLFVLAATLCATNTASALEHAQTKTRVWDFELPDNNSSGLLSAASSGKHWGNRLALSEVASDSLLAAEGATGVLYTAADVGPLPAAIANTFRGGSYTATTLGEATTLYRAYGGTAGQLGSFWTRTAPAGSLQATIDLALSPAWGNTASQVARISIPAGTTIFEGAAAGQGALLGGGSQVFIPSVSASWLLP